MRNIKDSFGRYINYLRVSVTDRCNYRCQYCAPQNKPCGQPSNPHKNNLLSFERIAEVVYHAVSLGISKVRLTGGEPLVRNNLENLISLISPISGLREITLTTNGSLLTREKALLLKNAGLTRLNISLDTIDPSAFETITGGGKLGDVYRGIAAAKMAGLHPIKLNMVISNTTRQADKRQMTNFARKHKLQLQTIGQFSLKDKAIGSEINADRPKACSQCNRLRLTADGFLLPCLFSNHEIPVDFNNITASLKAAVLGKPQAGQSRSNRRMMSIGG